MRPRDDTPLDPGIAAALEAIDAALAGEPVAPAEAELAELALLLRAERAQPRAEFARALDERVGRRFAPAPTAGSGRRRIGRWWLWTPAAGLTAAVAVAAVIVIGTPHASSSNAGARYAAAPSARSSSSAAAPGARTRKPAALASASAPGVEAPFSAPSAPFAPSAITQPQAPANILQPPPNGRKIIQGAQLSLTADANRIDQVAQEVFLVVGQVRGIVNSSTVTATGAPGGYAQFQLSIPSGSMPLAMASLSSLRYARVGSRTDTTQDVNNQYNGDVSKLAADRAIRASLLKQLANAATQGQIDSLTIRLHDINAAISGDQATLASLSNQIDFSQVTVTINGGVPPVPVHSATKSTAFGLGRAARDAGRVLTVAAGVALIGLAVLLPISLLASLAWWIAVAIRRRRREQALDLV